jgi:serine/threonine protein kinase
MQINEDDAPIFKLTGRMLKGGWKVGKLYTPPGPSTGGNFSVSYEVESENNSMGFLKAFDFRVIQDAPEPIEVLSNLVNSYNYERDLLKFCNERRIRFVVTSISDGTITIDDSLIGTVFYLIFELAEGNARTQIHSAEFRNIKWTMTAMHNVSVAIEKLHQHGVFHQDIKPSNVLVFNGGTINKLADLGRSHSDHEKSPWSNMVMPGDRNYAPLSSYMASTLLMRSNVECLQTCIIWGRCFIFLLLEAV